MEVEERVSDRVKLKFSVRDTGIGMTPEQLARLFQAFSQADTSTTRKFGGTGLGLSISKRLVEMMGGNIWAESEAGVGSTFLFTAWFGIGSAEQERKRFVPDLAGIRALVVDDNAQAREILSDALRGFALRADAVSSGQEAIQALAAADSQDPYQLVLMDWHMPGMDGLQASAIIRRDPQLKNVPRIVMVTAFGREEVRAQAEQIGIDAYLMKPVSASVLYDTLMELFGAARLETSAASARKDGLRRIRRPRHSRSAGGRQRDEPAGRHRTAGKRGSRRDCRRPRRHRREAASRRTAAAAVRHRADGSADAGDGRSHGHAAAAGRPEIQGPSHRRHDRPRAGGRARTLSAGRHERPRHQAHRSGRAVRDAGALDQADASRQRRRSSKPDAAGVDVALPDIEGIDIAGGLRRVAGNKRLYRSLLEQFATKQADADSKIREALRKGDRELAERLAHTLKGVAGNIGIESVQAAAAKVEKAIREDDVSVSAFVAELKSILSPQIDAIRNALGERAPVVARADSFDADTAAAAVARLMSLIEANDGDAADAVQEVALALSGKVDGGSLDALRTAIDEFDFDAARTKLSQIANDCHLILGQQNGEQ